MKNDGSIAFAKQLRGLNAIAVERQEKDKYRAELEEGMKKLLDDKTADLWTKLQEQSAERTQLKKEYEYDFDEGFKSDVTTVSKIVHTPIAEQGENKGLAETVQKLNDRVVAVAAITKRHPSQLNIWRKFLEGRSELKKALDTATSGQGSDWMPTQYSAEFIDRMEGEYKVAQLFRSITIPRGVDKIRIPGAGSAASVYLLSGSSDDDVDKIAATTPGTRYVELDPVKLGARVEIETDMDEDSAVAVADYVNEELRRAAARAVDDAIINGDTTATHLDSDVTSSADHRKAWDGLRDQTSSSWKIDLNDIVSATTFRQIWAKMSNSLSDYGDPEDLIVLVNSLGYLRLMLISETLTRDKRGELATVDTGRLDELFGIPIVVTSRVRRDLNASGVYDGATITKTLIQFANKRAFILGKKREVTVKSDENITTDRTRYVVTLRSQFKNLYESTEPVVAQGYDVEITT